MQKLNSVLQGPGAGFWVKKFMQASWHNWRVEFVKEIPCLTNALQHYETALNDWQGHLCVYYLSIIRDIIIAGYDLHLSGGPRYALEGDDWAITIVSIDTLSKAFKPTWQCVGTRGGVLCPSATTKKSIPIYVGENPTIYVYEEIQFQIHNIIYNKYTKWWCYIYNRCYIKLLN